MTRTTPLALHERSLLFQHLAAMEKAGVPPDRAYALLDLGERARAQVAQFCKLVARGIPPPVAGANSGLFTRFETRLLTAAFSAGSPLPAYQRLATAHAASERRRTRLRARFAMPVAVLVIALFVAPVPLLANGSLSGVGCADGLDAAPVLRTRRRLDDQADVLASALNARRSHPSHATIALMNATRLYLTALLSLLLAACGAPPPAPPAATPAVPQVAWYQQAARAGKEVYAIDSAQSLITIVVRRGGPLARFGHDHVVASRTVSGYAAPDAGRADFHFRLDELTVDEAALRTEAGLTTQPDADAIAGTRTNMLTRVLEAERFPLVLLHAQSQPGGMVRLAVTLHGVTRSMDVPVKLERSRGMLTASGQLTLLQTDFGITPMSVMGGAMRVEDPLEMRFNIVARATR